ncbi:hypothetical protein [Nannocystis punicea]|uniref:Uncharacterized protein n=1 Tax=Nannocystis punicea TaxID=2995304 RepID=A0ABY7H4T2_9BACT|nr:hypothetical protein [Nannocystis poenicansa]WAS94291.1 hypothetical protein O0S08_49855 [Nannocystis poenicansa]
MLFTPLLALALTSPAAAPTGAAERDVGRSADASKGGMPDAQGNASGASPSASKGGAPDANKGASGASPDDASKGGAPDANKSGTSPDDASKGGAPDANKSRTSPADVNRSASVPPSPSMTSPDSSAAGSSSTDASSSPAPAPTIRGAMVRVEGVEFTDLERALRVRLPSLALARQGEELPPGDGLRAFVDLRRTTPTQVQVALILSDGRAYFRVVDTEDEPPARPVAAALALLIAAIEDDSVAPDQRDVPVPPAIAVPPPPPVQAPVPENTVERTCPEVQPCPRPSAPAPPPPPAFELGLVRYDGASFGLDRPLAGVRGAMFGLGLDLRWRRGAIAAVELRATVAPVDRHTLARVRVAAGAGFGVRVRAFELPIVGLVGLEWWGLPGSDATVARAGARPLIGGGLRLSPGFWLRLPAVAVRAGARAELWASGEPGPDGPRKPLLARPGESPLAAVGGLELNLGLEISVWFDPGRRKRAGARGRGR